MHVDQLQTQNGDSIMYMYYNMHKQVIV